MLKNKNAQKTTGTKSGSLSAPAANWDIYSSYLKMRKKLGAGVEALKGIGKSRADCLARKGISTIEDLLFFLPRAYDDRSSITAVRNLKAGMRSVIRGEIVSTAFLRYPASGKRVFEMAVRDQTGTAYFKWFHYSRAQMENTYRKGMKVIASGVATFFRNRIEFVHPEVEIYKEGEEENLNFERIVPLYSEIEEISQKQIRRFLNSALSEHSGDIADLIPGEILARRGLVPLSTALPRLHFPGKTEEMDSAPAFENCRASLIFEELFFFQIGLFLKRKHNAAEGGIAFRTENKCFQDFIFHLPFRLTKAQERALAEIRADMHQPKPMYRMVQGDVGSGKTVLAFAAASIVIGDGFQAAFMAPTEILAEQHFQNFISLPGRQGLPAYLLTGSTSQAGRSEISRRLAAGEPCLLIGTHALVQQSVKFGRLGLVVVDEQHRFGVLQRLALKNKGLQPDMLVMTATPIPRTLSLTVYGDLDLSIVNELPRGRKPVKTRLISEKYRAALYRMIRGELVKGGQAYIVYPLVEESERMDLLDAKTMALKLQKAIFPDFKVGLLHGRLSGAEKAVVLDSFRKGGIHILVSTTVIEVGIDVPNATVMVVEHAERFGLSQLHQLRGRIGRGAAESWCILVSDARSGSIAWQRLKVLEETGDGFRIAEEDLRIRGPGDVLGTRQSGLPEFRTANILRDINLLLEAKDEVNTLLSSDPEFSSPFHSALIEIAKARWGEKFGLVDSG